MNALQVKLFTVAQRKRYKDVIMVQKTGPWWDGMNSPHSTPAPMSSSVVVSVSRAVRGWIVRRRFWAYVGMRWAAEKRRIRAETRHILDVCTEGKSTVLDFFKSDRGKQQVRVPRLHCIACVVYLDACAASFFHRLSIASPLLLLRILSALLLHSGQGRG